MIEFFEVCEPHSVFMRRQVVSALVDAAQKSRYIYMSSTIHLYVHICMHACMYVCMYVCMYIRSTATSLVVQEERICVYICI